MALTESTQSQLLTAGQSGRSIITGAPIGIADDLTWRLISDEDGTVAIAESSAGITEIDDGHDAGARRYDREFTAPSSSGRYLAVWRYFDEEIDESIIVEPSRDTAFAANLDVAKRLGRTLTTEEDTNQVPYLLTMAAVVIADAAGYDDGWAASLDPIPNMLRMMSVELVSRTMWNPKGVTSLRQQVGSYSIALARDTPGMELSDTEVAMIRRTVHGRTTASVHVNSHFELAQDEYWLRRQAQRMLGSSRDTSGVTS